MGQRLARVKETASGRYRVTFERAGGASEVVADFVVLALPFAVLNEIDLSEAGFDGLKHQAIAQQGRGRNGKLHLQFAERDWLGAGPWPGISNGSSYADTGYQVGWEATRAQGGQPGILVFYSGGSATDAASPIRHSPPQRTGECERTRRSRSLRSRRCIQDSRGTGKRRSRFRTRARSSIRGTPSTRSVSTPPSAASKAHGKAACCSAANTRRSIFRDSWKARRPRGGAPAGRWRE